LKVGFEESQRGVEVGSLGYSRTGRGLGLSSVGHSTIGEVLVELGNNVIAVGEVTVAAPTSSLALPGVLALEAEFIARRVSGDYVVSSSFPVGLEVSDGLVAKGRCCLLASHEATVGIGVLPLVLGKSREHVATTSSTSATMDTRNFNDSPQLRNLSLDNLHPLVGDPWEAITGLGLHGFKDAREIGCGNTIGSGSGPGRAQPSLDLALIRQHGPNGNEQSFLLAGGEHALQVLDDRAHDL